MRALRAVRAERAVRVRRLQIWPDLSFKWGRLKFFAYSVDFFFHEKTWATTRRLQVVQHLVQPGSSGWCRRLRADGHPSPDPLQLRHPVSQELLRPGQDHRKDQGSILTTAVHADLSKTAFFQFGQSHFDKMF